MMTMKCLARTRRSIRSSHSIKRVEILVLFAVCLLSGCHHGIVVDAKSTGALMKSASPIERSVWKAWYKQHYLWSTASTVKYMSPVQVVSSSSARLASDYGSSSTSRSSDWKLVMPTTALEEWEFYSTALSPSPRLENVEEEQQLQHPSPSSSLRSTTTTIKRQKKPRFLEDYNFKGFGISMYKSFLYLKSVGIAFRIPILANFDSWDRNPALPSVTAMLCLHYPFNISVSVTSSIRMEAVKWALRRMLYTIQDFGQHILSEFVRCCYILFSIFFFPIHGKWYEPPSSNQQQKNKWGRNDSSSSSFKTQSNDYHHSSSSSSTSSRKTSRRHEPISYKSDVQERLGCSMFLGFSPARGGFYRRASYWHMYLPTLRLCQDVLNDMKKNKKQQAQDKTSLSSSSSSKSSWWHKHFASLGVDTSCPNPLPPHLFCTAVLSLSGFYFGSDKISANNKKSKNKNKDAPILSSTSSKRPIVASISMVNFLLSDPAATEATMLTQHATDSYKKKSRMGVASKIRGGDLIFLPGDGDESSSSSNGY